MHRRTFDILASSAGPPPAALPAVAGALLIWALRFGKRPGSTALAAQEIAVPGAGRGAGNGRRAACGRAMSKYAGQLMTTGAQAQTYADHFIAVHLNKIGGGKTCSQLSAQSLANPSNAALKAQVDTVFKGETLRGLNAYAFWQIGQIA